jgi:hypothetical protein
MGFCAANSKGSVEDQQDWDELGWEESDRRREVLSPRVHDIEERSRKLGDKLEEHVRNLGTQW